MEIKQTAISYIKNMTINEKQKLKTMLIHNVSCGRVDPIMFNAELKSILEGK